jgi:hypothetical protein
LTKSARTSATAKTKTEADPYGMTNRKASATTTTTAKTKTEADPYG